MHGLTAKVGEGLALISAKFRGWSGQTHSYTLNLMNDILSNPKRRKLANGLKSLYSPTHLWVYKSDSNMENIGELPKTKIIGP